MAPAPARGPQAGVPAGAGWLGEDCGRWRHICKVQQPDQTRMPPGAEAPFSPTESGTNGVYVGVPIACAELSSRGQRPPCPEGSPVSLGASPRGPRRGARLAGVQGCDLGNQRHLPSGGFRAVCLEEVQTELPAAAAQRDTSSLDEWRSCSTCSPGSSTCFQTQEKAAKDSGSLRAALDKLDLHPWGSQRWSHKRMRVTLRPATT